MATGQLSEMVPDAPLPAAVIPFSCPAENTCTRLFPQSDTYKLKLVVIRIPRGIFSNNDVEPADLFPATIVDIFPLIFNDRRSTTWLKLNEQYRSLISSVSICEGKSDYFC